MIRPCVAYQDFGVYCSSRLAFARKIGPVYDKVDLTVFEEFTKVYDLWLLARRQFIQAFTDMAALAKTDEKEAAKEIRWGTTFDCYKQLRLDEIPAIVELLAQLKIEPTKLEGMAK